LPTIRSQSTEQGEPVRMRFIILDYRRVSSGSAPSLGAIELGDEEGIGVALFGYGGGGAVAGVDDGGVG